MNNIHSKIDLFSDLCYVRCTARLNTPPDTLALLQQAGINGNIEVFKTVKKAPIGYIAWVSITKECFNLMRKNNALPRYSYETNEGKLKVVFDVVFLPGWGNICKEMTFQCIKKNRLIGYIKRHKLHLIHKRLRSNNKAKIDT